MNARRLGIAAPVVLAALLLVGCDDVTGKGGSSAYSTGSSTISPRDADRPNGRITPGTVLTTNAADVCTPGWATAHRDRLTVAEERHVLDAYGLPTSWATESGHVSEWDHLISLQLGGGNGTRNIWPQLDHDQDQRKDRLETRLHTQVCHGELTLTEAQARVRMFWRYW